MSALTHMATPHTLGALVSSVLIGTHTILYSEIYIS